ncbi:rRNA maturation RNase YbeY [Anaplasma capra]|uniref:rRNA maturation RNase YbeY n=1 Tax=Anaplasma capra TaxID=1562740 RepID=UPI0021D5C4FA|nr:rRNA maturation RNase YbeY [Anaplasma capra]MCU7611163.1 rRNA maturation RNase YbeY [Anaplasma capra]MCU7612333.1 rRNA maturation RNase YbeY [Anaplasma capra]
MVEVSLHTQSWYRLVSKPKTSAKRVIRLCLSELDIARYRPRVFVVLANDELLLELNSRYRKIHKATNVLSFNYEALSQNCCLGEIYLSLERIAEESREMDVDIRAHFTHMLVHGMLHIMGYDHETSTEATIMQSLEIGLLKKLGVNNPYVPRET